MLTLIQSVFSIQYTLNIPPLSTSYQRCLILFTLCISLLYTHSQSLLCSIRLIYLYYALPTKDAWFSSGYACLCCIHIVYTQSVFIMQYTLNIPLLCTSYLRLDSLHVMQIYQVDSSFIIHFISLQYVIFASLYSIFIISIGFFSHFSNYLLIIPMLYFSFKKDLVGMLG